MSVYSCAFTVVRDYTVKSIQCGHLTQHVVNIDFPRDVAFL